jgi:hypothetical protein
LASRADNEVTKWSLAWTDEFGFEKNFERVRRFGFEKNHEMSSDFRRTSKYIKLK